MAKFQTKAFNGIRPMVLPDDASAEWSQVNIEMPATSPANGDFLQLCEIPIGYDVLDWVLVLPQVDSNGSPTFAFTLGTELADGSDLDTGNAVWASGLQIGRTTQGLARNASGNCAFQARSAKRVVSMKLTGAIATYAGATKQGRLLLLLAAN